MNDVKKKQKVLAIVYLDSLNAKKKIGTMKTYTVKQIIYL